MKQKWVDLFQFHNGVKVSVLTINKWWSKLIDPRFTKSCYIYFCTLSLERFTTLRNTDLIIVMNEIVKESSHVWKPYHRIFYKKKLSRFRFPSILPLKRAEDSSQICNWQWIAACQWGQKSTGDHRRELHPVALWYSDWIAKREQL